MTKKPCQRHEAALLRHGGFFPESPGDAAPQGDPGRKGAAVHGAGGRREAPGGGRRAPWTVERPACECAGILGCAPGPLTLRQLEWIVFARLRANWDETAAVLAHVTNMANAFAGVKSAVNPADLNPYRRNAPRAEGATVIDRQEAIELFKALAGGK